MTKFEWRMNSQPATTRSKYYPPRVSLQGLGIPRRFSLLAMMIGVTTFCALCGVIRWVTYYDEATDVTADEATRHFYKAWKPIRIPSSATHVNMHTSYLADGADFEISEEDFLKWCRERGFTLRKEQSLPPSPPLFLNIGPPDVRRAYSYSKRDSRGGGWRVVYDIDRRRAWFNVSPR